MSSTADKVLAALQAYKIEKHGHNTYRCRSPLRPESDSPSFSLTINGPEHGAWKDHAAKNSEDESGSLYDLAKRLGIEVERAEVEDSKRIYTSIADYAIAHGVSEETLAAAGWKEVVYQGRKALEFPTKSGGRWRFLDGEKPYYKSVRNYKPCWYGLKGDTIKRLLDGQPLIIANGEISTIVGRAYGLAVAAVTSGEKGIPHDLLTELKTELASFEVHPLILVALDCDSKGRTTAVVIAQQLIGAGFNARAVDLGLSDKGDLADFCQLYSDQLLPRLAALPDVGPILPSVQSNRTWIMLTEDELKSLPPVEWLVHCEIPKSALTVMIGQSGAGKSFLSLDYSLQLAALGYVVIYIAAEGEAGFAQRVKAWRLHHKNDAGKENMRYVLGAVNLFEPEAFEDFIQTITPLKPSLIVVDTLSMCMAGADENSSRDMLMIVHSCKNVVSRLDASVLLVHHLNKGGIVERGSGKLRDHADMMLKVSPDDDLVRLESSKTKDGSVFTPRYLRQVAITLDETDSKGNAVTSLVLEPAEKVIQTKSDPLTNNQFKILDALEDVFMDGASVNELVIYTSVAQSTTYGVIARLTKLGFISKSGEKYEITEDGKAALARQKLLRDSNDSRDSNPITEGSGIRDADKNEKTALESLESLESASNPQPDDIGIWLESAPSTLESGGENPTQTAFLPPPTRTHYTDGH